MKRPSRLLHMTPLGVDRMAALADASTDPNLLRMENIDTDLMPHESVVQATKDAVTAAATNSYIPLLGQDGLRKAIAAHVSRQSGVNYDWQKSAIVCAGAWTGILNVLLATIEPGDGVVLTAPVYAGLLNRTRLVGGEAHLVPFRPTASGWRLDLDVLRAAAKIPRLRAILLMNPNLPTGSVLTFDEWAAIAELCRERDLLLIYDAAMERVLYDGRQVIHPASFPGMVERTITIGSVSKEFRMIGWRVGWIVGPQEMIENVALAAVTNSGTTVGLSAAAAKTALELPEDDVKAAVGEWQKRRDLMLEELQDLVPIIPPHGGWTMMADVSALGITGAEASRRLFEKGAVSATSMEGWGDQETARYLRFVFSNEPIARLRGIGDRFRRALLT